jgi:DNA-binding response OmpR family regulator
MRNAAFRQVSDAPPLSTIWGYETFGQRNFVEAHVSRLRSKLAEVGAADVVSTVRGVGYVIR